MITCDEVTVKFTALHHNSQRIRALEVSGAKNLSVDVNSELVTIRYVNAEAKPMKIIIFNKKEVFEVCCEDNTGESK